MQTEFTNIVQLNNNIFRAVYQKQDVVIKIITNLDINGEPTKTWLNDQEPAEVTFYQNIDPELYAIVPRFITSFKATDNWLHSDPDSLIHRYLVLEYIQAVELCETFGLNDGSEKLILQNLYAALTLLHKHNIYHEDLHSSNILVLPDYTIKIIDFERIDIAAYPIKTITRMLALAYYS